MELLTVLLADAIANSDAVDVATAVDNDTAEALAVASIPAIFPATTPVAAKAVLSCFVDLSALSIFCVNVVTDCSLVTTVFMISFAIGNPLTDLV